MELSVAVRGATEGKGTVLGGLEWQAGHGTEATVGVGGESHGEEWQVRRGQDSPGRVRCDMEGEAQTGKAGGVRGGLVWIRQGAERTGR